ncbi:KAP family P-loop NTPase fold protein [Fusobacterium polymorphum]|jgi:KAP family P-loop domain protein|uniref:KAP family P-loop NTPase fold protein n=1 Tax=Fusobacterium nucleatum subsp. polymorphum TaxID=76857 RepID=UPI002B4C0E7C|nr:P-loop NTPase fold protein [Fusobacterium polymorphum]WRL71809.1 P-loop NTPase fold protein [Fusobacterium polymorphum]
MWKDSETELDFLDYDYLIQTVQSIITDDTLLPASIGVYGDWGSGKSSLMYMCKERLMEEDKKIKCLVFNGWLFENYEDAKTAILGTILDEISKEKNLTKKAKDIIKGLYKSIDKFKLVKSILKYGTDFLVTGGLNSIHGITMNQALRTTQEKIEATEIERVQSAVTNELNNKELREDIKKFQKEFTSLLEKTKINRLVVFIDELDRCRPDTILETLEAIKLFLFEGKVAFVIGADERHISYAVKSKFKDIEGVQIDIGKEYLEKLIQYPIRIPQLNADEMEIYIACLLLQSELEENNFQKALSWIIEKKKEDFEKFKINSVGKLFSDTENIHVKIVESLSIANQLAFVLSNGLHGNPRQCKRFLNSMYMRLQMASYKNKQLDKKILAKIMMLEYIKPRIFNKIAEMASNNTLSKELELFENGISDKADELKIWREDDWFLNWCKIKPELSTENLNTYFYFTRTSLDEKISRISTFLSPKAQEILGQLLSKTDIKIQQAIKSIINISDSDAATILEAMNSAMLAETVISKELMKAFLQFARQRTELTNDTLGYLQSFSGAQISLGCASYIADFANSTNKKEEIREIASQWNKTKPKLQESIEKLLEK